MQDIEIIVNKVRALTALKESDIEILAHYFQPFTYEKGVYIITQATSHRGWHILLSGSAIVQLKIFGGGKLDIATLKESDAFGEIGLISSNPSTANVIANEHVTGVLLTPENMATISIVHPDIAQQLKHAIALRCCEFSRMRLKYIPARAGHQQAWHDDTLLRTYSNNKVSMLDFQTLRDFLKVKKAVISMRSVFNKFSSQDIELLDKFIKLEVAYRGEKIKTQERGNNEICWLLWGAIQSVIPGDQIIKIVTYGPGDLINAIEYVDKLDMPYHYIAREDAIYFYLKQQDLLKIKEQSFPLWNELMNYLWASVGRHMSNINWLFLQMNAEDIYNVSKQTQGGSNV